MKVFVYDKKHSKQVSVLKSVMSCEFDKDSKYLTLKSENGDIHMWDTKQYKITLYQN